jgi:hypothetical protein
MTKKKAPTDARASNRRLIATPSLSTRRTLRRRPSVAVGTVGCYSSRDRYKPIVHTGFFLRQYV